MSVLEKVSALVDEAMNECGDRKSSLSSVIRKCVRIARLRNDFFNLWWLLDELTSHADKEARRRNRAEIILHLTEKEYNTLRKEFVAAYVAERKVNYFNREKGEAEEMIAYIGVEEIECDIEKMDSIAVTEFPPDGMHTLDLYYVEKEKSTVRSYARGMAGEYRQVLARVRQRVHEFLSVAEKEMAFGQLHSNAFERNRLYVDGKLSQIAPGVLEKFSAAYKRAEEEGGEARSQALLSCRRTLKAVADVVYPATGEVVEGRDGEKRTMSEDKYLARVWQFISDKIGGGRAGRLILSTVDELGNRLDRLNDLAAKGVHAEVSEFEVNLCVIHTYLIVGDLLRLQERDTGVVGEEEAEA